MTLSAPPFLLPDADSITEVEWLIAEGEAWAPLPEELPGWDSATDVYVRCAITVDWPRFRASCGLPADFPIACTLAWTSSTSQMRASSRKSFAPVVASPVIVEGTLPAARVGGVLTLDLTVHPDRDWPAAPAAVVNRSGSTLFRSTRNLVLEAQGSQFPVAVVDFGRTSHDPAASWFLSVDGPLEAPFHGVVLLLLNESDSELVVAASSGRPDARQQVLLDELSHQVAMQLLEYALAADQEEGLLMRDWPTDSVGDVLRQTLESVGDEAPRDSVERRAWFAGAARRLGFGRQFA